MHRKSIEAARHLKDGSGSEREGSEAEPDRATSASPHHHDNHAESSPGSSTTASSSARGRASPEPQPQQQQHRDGYEDPEAFRNNSIACLRAKAQEHQARILSNNLLLQVRGMSRPPACAPACTPGAGGDEDGPLDIDVGTEPPPLEAGASHPPPHLY